MPRKKRGLVETQPLKEIRGDSKSYEQYTNFVGSEEALGNPDCLSEQDNTPSSPQLVMGEAIEHLQGRQREVYILIMREDKSMAEAAEILDVSKSTVQTYLDRAIAFITNYCRAAISNGRV